jgi:hypothetical protein
MWVRNRDFVAHAANDDKQFEALFDDLDAKHTENRKALGDLASQITTTGAVLNDIVKLRPAIELGLAADAKDAYRRMLVKRVILSFITGGTVVGGLIPLIQFLATLRVHFG